jgi:hypothetical protein
LLIGKVEPYGRPTPDEKSPGALYRRRGFSIVENTPTELICFERLADPSEADILDFKKLIDAVTRSFPPET